MQTGLAIWHYPQRSLVENTTFFLSHGFQSVSSNGREFLALTGDKTQSDALSEALEAYNAPFTVHHKLPDPDDARECELFFAQIDQMRQWQQQYGKVTILSFDTWYDRERLYPYLLYAVKSFRGSNTRICCEDYPLNSGETGTLNGLEREPHFGILIDLGHMYLRLHKIGDTSLSALRKALEMLPLPIFELHIHSNDGQKDDHYFISVENTFLNSWAGEVKAFGFDGIATLECVPGWHNLTGQIGDEVVLRDLNTWKSWWE
jgi:sugar phosphate isomerase/epimerase